MSVSHAREYSRDGKHFAFINSQGKLVVYDVETSNVSQIYTPNLHLNVPCTCFAWVEIGTGGGGGDVSQSGKKKKKRGSIVAGGESQTMVAFGTSKGAVAIYSLASAKIEMNLKGAGHSGPVTAICVEGAGLYTAGADGKVIEWSLSEGEQKKVHNLGVEKLSCLAVAGSTILTGAKQLKVWDGAKGKLVKRLVGHTSNTVLVRKVAEEDFVLTGSLNDRNVSLWTLNGDEEAAIGLFTLDDAPAYLSSKVVDGKLHLLVVSKSGVGHYFIRSLDKISASKPVKANYTYEVAVNRTGTGSKAVDRLPIFTGSVEFSLNQEQLLLAYGAELSLKFEQITIDRDVKQNVFIREPAQPFSQKGQSEKDLKTKTPTVDKALAEFLNPVSAGKKVLKTVEIPMESRLENLSLTADGEEGKMTASQKNMAHLLVQGLHSKDAEILRSVFSRNEPELIQRTAERVPAQYVSVLLAEVSSLMQKKTVHVATAVCWLKALIHCHASQLMALGSDNLLSNFGTCLGIIEYRVEHANSLSKLSGRLEMLVGQIDRSERLSKNPNQLLNTQVLVHQEEDDSDVDSVLGKEHGSSEDEYDPALMDDDNEDNDDQDNEDEEDEDPLAGSFVRLRNGPANRSNGKGLNNTQNSQGSDDEEEDEDEEDEEMDVSD